jgi:hypothetical protein
MDIEDLIDALNSVESDTLNVEVEVQHTVTGEVIGYGSVWSVEVRETDSGDKFVALVTKIQP